VGNFSPGMGADCLGRIETKPLHSNSQVMTSINISLPELMKVFVEEQVAQGDYNSASEYVQELISQDQKRKAQERLEGLIIEGLDSGEPIEVTDEWWEQKRTQLMDSLRSREE